VAFEYRYIRVRIAALSRVRRPVHKAARGKPNRIYFIIKIYDSNKILGYGASITGSR